MSKRSPDGNLLAASPPTIGERFDVLRTLGGVEIERIVSSDTPDQGEYDQAWPEWVLLIEGGAELELAGAHVTLGPGDYLHIPAGAKHRVLQTQPGTVWLALHAKGEAG